MGQCKVSLKKLMQADNEWFELSLEGKPAGSLNFLSEKGEAQLKAKADLDFFDSPKKKDSLPFQRQQTGKPI